MTERDNQHVGQPAVTVRLCEPSAPSDPGVDFAVAHDHNLFDIDGASGLDARVFAEEEMPKSTEAPLDIDTCSLRDVASRLNSCFAECEFLKKVATKLEDSESVRRGQLDCISERIYLAERNLRQAEERQDEAIEKASATFQKQSSNLMHVINQVNSNFEHLSQQIATHGGTLSQVSAESRSASMAVESLSQDFAAFDKKKGSSGDGQAQEHAISELQIGLQALRESVVRMTPHTQFSEAEARQRSLSDRLDALQKLVHEAQAQQRIVHDQLGSIQDQVGRLAAQTSSLNHLQADQPVRGISIPRAGVLCAPSSSAAPELLDTEHTSSQAAARRRMASSAAASDNEHGHRSTTHPSLMVQQQTTQPQVRSPSVMASQSIGLGNWIFETESAPGNHTALAPSIAAIGEPGSGLKVTQLPATAAVTLSRSPLEAEGEANSGFGEFFQDDLVPANPWESTAEEPAPSVVSRLGEPQLWAQHVSSAALTQPMSMSHPTVTGLDSFGASGSLGGIGVFDINPLGGNGDLGGAAMHGGVLGNFRHSVPDASSVPTPIMTAGYTEL